MLCSAVMNSDSTIPRKLLVALDGSRHSHNALHYLAGLFAGQEYVRFHLLSLVAGVALPAGGEWLSEEERLNMLGSEAQKRLRTHRGYLRSAEEYLIKQGVGPERISKEVLICRATLAADIAHEARKGLYDAMVLGRRGMTKLEEVLLGGVSVKLLEQCHDVPQWIIDGEVDSHRFLVPVDGSPYSLMAVDHLAFMLGNHPDAEITLFHSTAILAEQPQFKAEDFHRQWDPDWCHLHLHQSTDLFQAPRQLLLDAGFPPHRIKEEETSKGFEPSRQILRQAMIDDYGTIVLGRRGAQIKKGVFRGVSDRVLLMAQHVAVWVIG